jgi:threonine synthase
LRSIWTYDKYLPTIANEHRIFLGEGQTPLIRSRSIGRELGVPELYFKLENLNPTGSYKDRFAAMFVSILKSKSKSICLATSSGNTGAALAAYCAAANIKCILAIVDGAPPAKVKQMQVFGASTFMIKDFGKDTEITKNVFEYLESTASSLNIPLPISAYRFCSEGMTGVQTMSYEIMDEIQGSINHIFSPAGGGGLTLAVAKGVGDHCKQNSVSKAPKVHCVQPEGNDTMASALNSKSGTAAAVTYSTTAISGLQVPNVLDGDAVIEECRKLNGKGYVVSDQLVFELQRELALQEGIFCEPAGAVAMAGFLTAVKNREVSFGEKVVCIVTGSGFKDISNVDEHYRLTEPEKLDGIHAFEEELRKCI